MASLTIAIPTYNRVVQIQEQVRRLLPQVNEQVKLVVYDNCSSIPVRNLFSEDELEKFDIFENGANIGADANIARCLEMCKTRWLWTLGDDDYIFSTAVKEVLSTLDKYPDAIWINFNYNKNVILNNFVDFAEDNNNIESFGDSYWISKCVYNIEKLRPSLFYYYKNVSSMIGQFTFILKHMETNTNCYLVRTTTKILEKTPPGGWETDDYIRHALLLFDAFDNKKRKFLRKNVLKTLTHLCLCVLSRTRYSGNEMGYLLKMIVSKFGVWNTIITFPYLLCKNLIIMLMPYQLYSLLKKIKSRIFIKRT